MGFPFTIVVGFLFTIVLGIQLTISSGKLQIVHPLFLGLAFIILIANLAFCLIEREPLE